MTGWVVKDYVDAAARECSITPPANWITATTSTEMQFKQFLADVARELLQRHEWAACAADTTFTGGGSVYSLPVDYFRVFDDGDAVYEISPMRRPVKPMPNRGDWTVTKTWNWTGSQRYYRLLGSSIEFQATLPVGASVKMAYLKNTWAVSSDGVTPRSVWSNVADISYIPAYLLQLGIIWRWRRSKGLVYADRRSEFESELARCVGDDGNRRKVDFSGPSTDTGNPMRVPVPDFIPSS
jgi:hypothetical protein